MMQSTLDMKSFMTFPMESSSPVGLFPNFNTVSKPPFISPLLALFPFNVGLVPVWVDTDGIKSLPVQKETDWVWRANVMLYGYCSWWILSQAVVVVVKCYKASSIIMCWCLEGHYVFSLKKKVCGINLVKFSAWVKYQDGLLHLPRCVL